MTIGGNRWRRYESSIIQSAYSDLPPWPLVILTRPEPLLALPRVVPGQHRDLSRVQFPSRRRDHHDTSHHPSMPSATVPVTMTATAVPTMTTAMPATATTAMMVLSPLTQTWGLIGSACNQARGSGSDALTIRWPSPRRIEPGLVIKSGRPSLSGERRREFSPNPAPLLPPGPDNRASDPGGTNGTAVSQLAVTSPASATWSKRPLAPSSRTRGTGAAPWGREPWPRGSARTEEGPPGSTTRRVGRPSNRPSRIHPTRDPRSAPRKGVAFVPLWVPEMF